MSDYLERLKRRSRPTELQGLIGNPDEAYVSAEDLRSAIAEIEGLRGLVLGLIENDPNDDAADGITVLDVWRKDARAALSRSSMEGKSDD